MSLLGFMNLKDYSGIDIKIQPSDNSQDKITTSSLKSTNNFSYDGIQLYCQLGSNKERSRCTVMTDSDTIIFPTSSLGDETVKTKIYINSIDIESFVNFSIFKNSVTNNPSSDSSKGNYYTITNFSDIPWTISIFSNLPFNGLVYLQDGITQPQFTTNLDTGAYEFCLAPKQFNCVEGVNSSPISESISNNNNNTMNPGV